MSTTGTMQGTLGQKAQQAARHRRVDAWRVWAVLGLLTLFAAYNGVTVFRVQVLQYQDLSNMAESRIKWKDTLMPRRGLIYDSRGILLAGNTTADDVYVDKSRIEDDDAALHKICDLLAPVLGQQPGDMFRRLKEASGINIRVASRIDDDTAARVRRLKEDFPDLLQYRVTLDPQPLRQYPAVDVFQGREYGLAAAVLGYTDHDNQGHYGVEEYYNDQLAGEAGWIYAEHDAYGRPLVLQQPEMQPARDGADLVLTIDSAIQYLAEQELHRSIEEFKADSGYVVVQDPNTGAILALASWPTFDPNRFNKVTDYGLFKNPVVSDVREPGSTMKILTYASAIDAGAITPNTTFYGRACVVKYGWPLCNATHTEWGWQTMTQGLGRSDNVAAIYAAEQLGQDAFYTYIRAFGIGQRTGIDLPGEVAGLVNWPGDPNFSPVDFYTTAFGQSAATTPIQLVNAISAVANGGVLLRPYVMKEIRQDDKVIARSERQEVRRVISPQTAGQIADMLAYGVEHGMVARYAYVPGYHVSVKTGTAQLPDENGGYKAEGTFASAMGFAPSHGARFTLYIGLMHPRTSPWGENTASVAWGRLAKQILLYMKVQPTEPLPTPTPAPAP